MNREELAAKILNYLLSLTYGDLNKFHKVNYDGESFNLKRTSTSSEITITDDDYTMCRRYILKIDRTKVFTIKQTLFFKSKMEKLFEKVIANIEDYIENRKLKNIRESVDNL